MVVNGIVFGVKTPQSPTCEENATDHARIDHEDKGKELEVACHQGSSFTVRKILGSQCSLYDHLQLEGRKCFN